MEEMTTGTGENEIEYFEKKERSHLADFTILGVILVLVCGIAIFIEQGSSSYVEKVQIDLSARHLPQYTLLSFTRTLIAISFSYVFTVIYGTLAAKSRRSERILIPLLDVLQSLPVLTFLPGFVIILTSIFSSTRWGIEIACILLIFTGQVWNLTFAYYESQKTMPNDFHDLARTYKFSRAEQLFLIDLPNGVRPLVFNGMMSMAGGWFFLTLCESFVLNRHEYILPGLGSYLFYTFQKARYTDFLIGIVALLFVIIGSDFLIWKPLMSWSRKFVDTATTAEASNTWFLRAFKKSRVPRLMYTLLAKLASGLLWISGKIYSKELEKKGHKKMTEASPVVFSKTHHVAKPRPRWISQIGFILLGVVIFSLFPRISGVSGTLSKISAGVWLGTLSDLLFTLSKVVGVIVLSSLWTIPVGLWIGRSPKRMRIFQPLIQSIAAFPAPVLYPLVVMLLVRIHVSPWLVATLLMTLGNQWYMLFNVMSGTSRISVDLQFIAKTFRFNTYEKLTKIYLPVMFPSLITGWLSAAGGAWNASIAAELATFPGGVLDTPGLGSSIAKATETGDYSRLIACIVTVSVALILINRIVWHPLHEISEDFKES